MIKVSKPELVVFIFALSACVVSPGYYDGGPGPGPAPYYGYYGYAPAYPWDMGGGVDIVNGYGHGGYYGRGGGYGGGGYGGRGGGRGGGGRH